MSDEYYIVVLPNASIDFLSGVKDARTLVPTHAATLFTSLKTAKEVGEKALKNFRESKVGIYIGNSKSMDDWRLAHRKQLDADGKVGEWETLNPKVTANGKVNK